MRSDRIDSMTHDPLAGCPPFMTTAQVAAVTQIKPSTLFAWRRDGGGPPFVRLGEGRGSSVRYPREDLRVYLAGRTVRAEA
jgi:predicted DNA-binding transcriptional regulator AlpA